MTYPQTYPTPSPRPPRNRSAWKWPLIVFGIAALLVVVVAVGSNNRPAGSGSAISSNTPTTASATPTPATSTSTTPSPPPPPPPPPAPPEVFQGKGDNVLAVKRGAAPGIVTFECPKCTGNVIVESDGRENLLVNAIGAYTGQKLINIADGSMTTSISVQAKGTWKLTVAGLDTIETVSGKPATGKGDSVVMMASSFSAAAITHTGKGNFIVTYADLSTSRMGLAVNEIGSYEGTVRLPGPSIVEIQSEGTWTIAPN